MTESEMQAIGEKVAAMLAARTAPAPAGIPMAAPAMPMPAGWPAQPMPVAQPQAVLLRTEVALPDGRTVGGYLMFGPAVLDPGNLMAMVNSGMVEARPPRQWGGNGGSWGGGRGGFGRGWRRW